MNITEKLTEEFKIKRTQTEETVALIDEGNTIPFIARYRKEATGGLSDVILRELADRLVYLRNLETRKDEVLRLIDEQGKLTAELETEIRKAEILQRVEDLYKPYVRKRATRASKAREKGLEPLAEIVAAQTAVTGDPRDFARPFVNAEKGVADADEALAGAADILAERIADDPDLTAVLREKTRRTAFIESEATEPGEPGVYDMYREFSESVAKIPDHRILAVNRGEKEKKLRVRIRTDADSFVAAVEKRLITNPDSVFAPLLRSVAADSYKRLIAPALERETRAALTERAETEAVKVFAKNTENLLMAPPVKGMRVIAIDPGFRTGCKVAVLSETGRLRAYTTVFPTEPRRDTAGTEAALKKLIDKFGADVIVIGNGTASRETEEVVAEFIRKYDLNIGYTIVNEAGASVYSASKVATEEYPDLDVAVRGAMSLGRRLQDPMAELVKIPPRHIGVGQYQHDIDGGRLEHALSGVVENCVNRVGVDLNTASASLLAYVAGVNTATARNIVAWREENGGFADRKQLKKVPELGDKAFAQCAGFLRITGGKNPLDGTAVHPESYAAATDILRRLDVGEAEIAKGGVSDIERRIGDAYPARSPAESLGRMAADVGLGAPTLADIVAEIRKPARDPREDAPPVVLRRDVKRFEDLRVGMEMSGTVRNVVDFGAFVDIGVKNDGLVHISRMSDRYVKHPTDIVGVGDTVRVWIANIDPTRNKVGLSMVAPGAEKEH